MQPEWGWPQIFRLQPASDTAGNKAQQQVASSFCSSSWEPAENRESASLTRRTFGVEHNESAREISMPDAPATR